jgi:hypothetical protein
MPNYPASGLIVAGLSFKDYAPKTFEKKMIYGEDNNILSPMFPEEGKWFYHYDPRKHILTLACPDCAEAGKAGSCPSHHKKVTISLTSHELSVGSLEGFAVRLAHGDEHIPEEFYKAMQMRVADSPGGCLILTGTPLHGPEAWEVRELTHRAEKPPIMNRRNPNDENSDPLVSLHWCSMKEGGLVSDIALQTYKEIYDEFEYECRVMGRPAALASNPVFDRKMIAEMQKVCRPPLRGNLMCGIDLQQATDKTPIDFMQETNGKLRIWEKPIVGQQYIISVDTAAGLSKKANDPSCASVLKMILNNGKVSFEMVAQFHDWIPIHEYTDEVFKLALYYNSGLVVVELTGGLGRAVIERLKKELLYWNIFRDASKGEYAEFRQDMRFGIDTSASSKPSMIAVLQQVIHDGRLLCYCSDTLSELVAYEQERTDSGHTRYRGAGGTHDDRVMSLVIGISIAISHGLVDVLSVLQKRDSGQQKSAISEELSKYARLEMRAEEW